MKTAVIISGQTRTFRHCWRTLHWCLFRKLPKPHFFVSVADDAAAPDMDLLRQRFEHVHIEYVTQPEIAPPDRELGAHSGWVWHAPVDAILKQLWALQRGYHYFRECAGDGLKGFDLIVRCRPDLWAQDIELPRDDGTGWVPQEGPCVGRNDCWTPWWSSFGGVNDRMAIMGPDAAPHYFGTFSNREILWDMGCPLHTETMIKASLELGSVTLYPRLQAEFRICRLNDKGGTELVKESFWPHELVRLVENK